MRSVVCGVLLLAVGSPAMAASRPHAVAVMAEFDRIGAGPLWPGFDPRRVPVAIYDGEDTWLFRHPSPPAGFSPATDHEGASVFPGRHASVRANTSADLGGVPTATAVLERTKRRSTTEQAALLIHEVFHVFQDRNHPGWAANEVELFVYPLEDPRLLQLRRLETMAFRRALGAKKADEMARWALAALTVRRERFGSLSEGSIGYERGTEMREGLARYVEHRAARRRAAKFPKDDFAVDEFRARSYATGLALGLLLDRFLPGWASEVEGGERRPLDELLEAALAHVAVAPAAFSEADRRTALARARFDIDAFLLRRAERRTAFMGQRGWKIVVVPDRSEPLGPRHFDPLNIRRLGEQDLLHTRWLQLGNSAATLEVLNADALSEGCGGHPLFSGVCRLTLAGIQDEPVIVEAEDRLTVETPGFTGEFRGARVERAERTVTITLSPEAPGGQPDTGRGS